MHSNRNQHDRAEAIQDPDVERLPGDVDGNKSSIVTGFVADQETLPPGYFYSPFFLGSMAAIGIGLCAGQGSFAFPAPILTLINNDIGPNPNINWVALVHPATLAVFLTVVGRLSDIFGRRWFFIGGGALALVGSVVSATAQSVPQLIAGNTIAGIASSTQISYIFTMGELLPMKYRFYGGAAMNIFLIPGSGLAPAISRAFTTNTTVGWRGVFYLLIALNAVSLACWVLFYHPPTFEMKHGSDTKLHWIKHFDYVGTLLYAAGLALFLLGLSWGGSVYPWKSASVIACMLVGVLCVVAFVLWECYIDLREPLVPMRLFLNRPWLISTLLAGSGSGVYYACALVWPQMVTDLYPSGSPVEDGFASSVGGLGIVTGTVTGNMLAVPVGKTKWQCTFYFLVGGIFLGLVALAGIEGRTLPLAFVFIACFIIGAGDGVSLSNTTITMRDQQEIGTGAGVAGSLRASIGAVCSTIYTVILSNRLQQTMAGEFTPAVLQAGLPKTSIAALVAAIGKGTAAAFAAVPGLTPAIKATAITAYKVAYKDAFKTVFLSSIAFSGAAVVLSLFSPNVDDLMSGKVAATLHQAQEERGKDAKNKDEKSNVDEIECS